ncbi:histidine kinase [Massilia sp. IC2-278]|uniref:sensor histidine kinase n=1 Tax=Massilia sp. IC2-278 TaxID=2887200 RepID=UPI001E35E054|nr:histidine kinase [Massilia sp. IC2-278]MCC2963655.1 histidine kinase [Massilia sp. IC2-278]
MTMSSHPPEPAPRGVHPLEVLAPFRRIRASPLRNLVYTFVWNCLIGLALAAAEQWLAGRPGPFGPRLAVMLVGANVVGFLIHGALYGLRRFAPLAVSGKGWRPRLAQMAVSGIGALLGIGLMRVVLSNAHPLDVLRSGPMITIAVYAAGTAIIIRLVLFAGERRIERETHAARQQEQIAAAGRMLAEARLRALQAQIEPHFLYNTLANVVSLIDTQPAQARRMLERFIDYLRASLAASRADSATLGGELDLVRAYLDVLGVRMGARLRYRIEADSDTRQLPIAPMLLQPLVENAIMHGIEPKMEGGEVLVRARLVDDALCVEVSDSGMGLGHAAPRPGGGVGLSNLRERVQRLHGPTAQLQLIENQPCGVTSRLLLPLTKVTPSIPPAP